MHISRSTNITTTKYKPIAQTVHIGSVNLVRLANKVIDKVFDHVVHQGKDKAGRRFQKYSKGYKKKVQMLGNRPNLFLSGKMMKALKVRTKITITSSEDSIIVGWNKSKQTEKLVWNESKRGKKRNIANDFGDFPFNKKIGDWFFFEVNKILHIKVKKTSESRRFKINM